MPTYQYSCTECGHFLEVVQAFTDDSLTECPECGGRLRKVFGAVGVVFKGSGFYRTDSRTGGGEGSDTAAAPAKKAGEKSSETASGSSSTSGETSPGSSKPASGGASTGSSGSSGGSSTSTPKSA